MTVSSFMGIYATVLEKRNDVLNKNGKVMAVTMLNYKVLFSWWTDYSHTTFVLYQHTHTHIRLTALCPGLPRWAGTRKEKPIWILLKQETVSGNGIRWAICKSAPRSSQITWPTPHHSVFYRPDALPATQPTASKHWRRRLSCTKSSDIVLDMTV